MFYTESSIDITPNSFEQEDELMQGSFFPETELYGSSDGLTIDMAI